MKHNYVALVITDEINTFSSQFHTMYRAHVYNFHHNSIQYIEFMCKVLKKKLKAHELNTLYRVVMKMYRIHL